MKTTVFCFVCVLAAGVMSGKIPDITNDAPVAIPFGGNGESAGGEQTG